MDISYGSFGDGSAQLVDGKTLQIIAAQSSDYRRDQISDYRFSDSSETSFSLLAFLLLISLGTFHLAKVVPGLFAFLTCLLPAYFFSKRDRKVYSLNISFDDGNSVALECSEKEFQELVIFLGIVYEQNSSKTTSISRVFQVVLFLSLVVIGIAMYFGQKQQNEAKEIDGMLARAKERTTRSNIIEDAHNVSRLQGLAKHEASLKYVDGLRKEQSIVRDFNEAQSELNDLLGRLEWANSLPTQRRLESEACERAFNLHRLMQAQNQIFSDRIEHLKDSSLINDFGFNPDAATAVTEYLSNRKQEGQNTALSYWMDLIEDGCIPEG